ncbi:hypothetical protein [Streptomyces sp. NBC_00162]|uniref:hypothetical protein n=1 Tax=Streptomyces sp. NBC_00162 TaxID=2903629 RepID=UPI00214CE6C1|nr:hypothetical protein [Streptomyces sp. NBC_00162]UUU44117.1 hypothetical protein JIW86_38270 [Streptomyces sp. NBC_00162]
MDNNEQRHRTAGRGPAPISLPAVAWHAAGEEPAAEPVAPRPPLTLPVLTPEAPTGAVRPEPAAEPEPEAAPACGAVPEVPVPAAEEAAGAEEIAEAEEVAEAEEAPQEAAPDALAATPVAAPAAPTGLRPARRIPKPMLAAAATSGVVLMGVPLLFSQLGGDAGPGRVPSRPTGYNQPDGGPEGFVPGTDVPDKGSVLPGAVAPGAAADAPGQGSANTPVTNTGTGQSGDGQGSPGGGPAGGPAAGSGGTSGNPGSAGSPDTGARHDPQQSGPAPQAPPAGPGQEGVRRRRRSRLRGRGRGLQPQRLVHGRQGGLEVVRHRRLWQQRLQRRLPRHADVRRRTGRGQEHAVDLPHRRRHHRHLPGIRPRPEQR